MYEYKVEGGLVVTPSNQQEASDKLEENPELMLRLIDLIFLGAEDSIPS